MALQSIVRGSTVVFAVSFTGADGEPASPSSANLYLSYKLGRGRQSETIAMTENAGTWSASWNSEVADAGQLDWHVRSDDITNKSALEGSLQVLTNRANPAP